MARNRWEFTLGVILLGVPAWAEPPVRPPAQTAPHRSSAQRPPVGPNARPEPGSNRPATSRAVTGGAAAGARLQPHSHESPAPPLRAPAPRSAVSPVLRRADYPPTIAVPRVRRQVVTRTAPVPTVQVVVDAKGAVRIARSTWKRLRARPAENGMVCLEFPREPHKGPAPVRDEHGHSHSLQDEIPRRIWAGPRADGTVFLPRTRMGAETVPGPPGTVYLVRSESGRLVLRPIAGRR